MGAAGLLHRGAANLGSRQTLSWLFQLGDLPATFVEFFFQWGFGLFRIHVFQFKVCLETILFHLLERNILGFAQEAEPLLSVSVVEANEEEEILLDRDSERQEGDGGG